MSLDPFCEFDKLRADLKRKKKSTILSFQAKTHVLILFLFLFSAGSEFVDQDSLDGQLPSSS